MPFITQEQRLKLENGGEPEVVGDLCYLAYKEMVHFWKVNPRWTTAHQIYNERSGFMHEVYYRYYDVVNIPPFSDKDFETAKELAWQVFFQNYVMPYEREKERENGTI